MNITQPGVLPELPQDVTHEFNCPRCECKFEAHETECKIRLDDQMRPYLGITCPTEGCGYFIEHTRHILQRMAISRKRDAELDASYAAREAELARIRPSLSMAAQSERNRERTYRIRESIRHSPEPEPAPAKKRGFFFGLFD